MPPTAEIDEPWTVEKSTELYGLEGWGAPYFRIGETGHIDVDPTGHDHAEHSIDLPNLVQDLVDRGHNLPLLIRFSNILDDRIDGLNKAFAKAIAEAQYANVYRGVFPVKVCQQRHVIDEVVEYGKKYQYGLEAGSKPELLIALAAMTNEGALVTCNGYKGRRCMANPVSSHVKYLQLHSRDSLMPDPRSSLFFR